MKRAQDKIKDFVDPQTFDEVLNVAADPARAVAAYRFTEPTSELLVRWLDALVTLSAGRGAARALAGSRGVGKSHTLAVFGALVGVPELRAGLPDDRVATSAGRLSKRTYKVVRVERGTRETLQQEMAAAFAKVFNETEIEWSEKPSIMLASASVRLPDARLVVIIDTAYGREDRVSRDDGPDLGDLATVAQHVDALVALALDDDISGADGVNMAIAGTFQIDYLDPEHLYRIADSYLLRKNARARAALHEMYQTLRSTVPSFNWSEQRFAALYPIHPLVADMTAAVRLHVPGYGFLAFAAALAARAASRPALSLVLLDEVFDRAEPDLRQAKMLREAFVVYDELATRGVAQFPVMQRLQAKLVLKTLFIMSLDGRGATATELCAALLFTEEDAPGGPVRLIGELLKRFADAAPGGTVHRREEGEEIRYQFQTAAPIALAAAPVAPSPVAVASSLVADDSDIEEHTVDAPSKFTGEVVEAATRAEAPASLDTLDGLRDALAEPDESHAETASVNDAPSLNREELTAWARRLTGQDALAVIGEREADKAVRIALADWLDEWRAARLLEKFDKLPEQSLTTRVWDAASAVRRSFDEAVEAIVAALADATPLEDALRRIAEAFACDADEFERRRAEFDGLSEFVEGHARRTHAHSYIALAESTGVDEIESARRELLKMTGDAHDLMNAARGERFDLLWHEFHTRYGDLYAAAHDRAMSGAGQRRGALDALRRGDRWREFESLARLPVVSRGLWRAAEDLLERAGRARCALPVAQLLIERPVCGCAFRLSQAEELERLPQELETLVERGLAVCHQTLALLSEHLAIALDALARKEEDADAARRARALSAAFARGAAPAHFSRADVLLVEHALQRMAAPPPVRVSLPAGDYGLLTREELRARLVQWLDEMPEQPVLIQVVAETEDHALQS